MSTMAPSTWEAQQVNLATTSLFDHQAPPRASTYPSLRVSWLLFPSSTPRASTSSAIAPFLFSIVQGTCHLFLK